MKIRVVVVFACLFCFAAAMSAQSSKKTMRSTGRVIAVAPDSIKIRPGNTDLTFVVDTSTKVVGKGVGTKIQALKAANKSPQITDLIDEYDNVTVEYLDLGGGKLHANRIDVRGRRIKKE